jgi:hypothetical protein
MPLTSSLESMVGLNRQWSGSGKREQGVIFALFILFIFWPEAPHWPSEYAEPFCLCRLVCASPSETAVAHFQFTALTATVILHARHERTRRVQKVCTTAAAGGRLGRTHALGRRVCWRRPAPRPRRWWCLVERFVIQRCARHDLSVYLLCLTLLLS